MQSAELTDSEGFRIEFVQVLLAFLRRTRIKITSWKHTESEFTAVSRTKRRSSYRKHNRMTSALHPSEGQPHLTQGHHSPVKTFVRASACVHVPVTFTKLPALCCWMELLHVFKFTVSTGNTILILQVNHCWETEVITVILGKENDECVLRYVCFEKMKPNSDEYCFSHYVIFTWVLCAGLCDIQEIHY